MRKFELIKAYPNSEPIGTIFEFLNGYYRVKLKPSKKYSKELVETNTEYWKEIKKEEYEILSFRDRLSLKIHKRVRHSYTDSVLYMLDDEIDTETLDWFLQYPNFDKTDNYSPKFEINSVKRLSDGVVFTIGDRVFKGDSKIDNFVYTEKYGISVHYSSYHPTVFEDGGMIGLLDSYLQKGIKLLTTEDAVDIYEGDEYYFVPIVKTTGYKEFSVVKSIATSTSDFSNPREWIDFSTKEKAKEYVVMNKPCLSINDLLSIGFIGYNANAVHQWKELVKRKLEKFK